MDDQTHPVPLGVLRKVESPCAYDGEVKGQITAVTEKKGRARWRSLINSGDTWTVS